MEIKKKIIIIGCGDEAAIQSAIAQIARSSMGVPTFHVVEPSINKEELKLAALSFQEQDYQVMVMSDGLDIANELRPESIRMEAPPMELRARMEIPKLISTGYYEEPKSKFNKPNTKNWKRN